MNVPPIIGLIVSLALGIVIGSFSTYQYMDKAQVEADAGQIKKDNKVAADIDAVTVEAKKTNTVTKVVTKWRDRPSILIPPELSDDEINTICNNHLAPDDVVRSLRSEAARAWSRFNDMQNDSFSGR